MDLMVFLCILRIYSVKLNFLLLGVVVGVGMSLNPSAKKMSFCIDYHKAVFV